MKQFGKEARLLSCANYIQLKGDDKGISWEMGVKVGGFEKEKNHWIPLSSSGMTELIGRGSACVPART